MRTMNTWDKVLITGYERPSKEQAYYFSKKLTKEAHQALKQEIFDVKASWASYGERFTKEISPTSCVLTLPDGSENDVFS
ncbi:unnamed protein product [Ilex paraguariensis]|uniref:Uncharacterized protein n=1 Tax=Ilex paraguariensis TaxID=185542 RepID=A0ABC8R9E3_9AQUA